MIDLELLKAKIADLRSSVQAPPPITVPISALWWCGRPGSNCLTESDAHMARANPSPTRERRRRPPNALNVADKEGGGPAGLRVDNGPPPGHVHAGAAAARPRPLARPSPRATSHPAPSRVAKMSG